MHAPGNARLAILLGPLQSRDGREGDSMTERLDPPEPYYGRIEDDRAYDDFVSRCMFGDACSACMVEEPLERIQACGITLLRCRNCGSQSIAP